MKQSFQLLILILFISSTIQAQKLPKPFVVKDKSPMLSIYASKSKKSTINNIIITSLNSSGGAKSMTNGVMPPAKISEIESLQGSFVQKQILSTSDRGQVLVLKDVNYPFHARFYVEGKDAASIVEVEFNEPGAWDVNISVAE